LESVSCLLAFKIDKTSEFSITYPIYLILIPV
jgi:hypothetical protein